MKVEWTKPALLDLESIRDYIRRDSEYYASRFIEKIRELLFSNYRIMYRMETERILILTVIHGARNLSQKKPKPWSA